MGTYRMCMCFTRRFKDTEAAPPQDVIDAFNMYSEGGPRMTAEQLRRFLTEVRGQGGATLEEAEGVVQKLLLSKRHDRDTLSLDDFHRYLFSADLNPPMDYKVLCFVWTLTAPVKLIKCFKSIKEHAFSTSHYPVVITLEDHLSPDLHAKVAEMVTETFGEMLFYPEYECLKEFPTPEDLKDKIIISTKPPKEYYYEDKMSSSQKGNNSYDDVWGKEPTVLIADQEDDKTDSDASENNQDDNDDDDRDAFEEPELRTSGAPDYKRLIAIHAGKPKGGLREALKVELDKVRRLSLSEQALEKATKSHGTDVVRFTQKNFLRIYPKGTRVNSSNYKPMIGWMHGAQMVAFNMQGYGRSLWLMHGMFRSNGGCGYVKKPDFLMNEGQVFDPKANLPVKKTLKVKVYMGDGWRLDFKKTYFDLCSPPDFYARVGIAGVRADETMKETKKIQDNWTPVWDEEFTFPLTVPELALLRVEVHEYDMPEKDDFAGQTCLPVSELKSGIRAVPLFDRKGKKLNSVTLLMRFVFV
ncbi:hypothetical protein PTKIN_Ptkin03bG0053100 [Pterospermum kingtungense]